MNVNHFDPKKTALLFFDILNGYVPEPEPGKKPSGRVAGFSGVFTRAMSAPVFVNWFDTHT